MEKERLSRTQQRTRARFVEAFEEVRRDKPVDRITVRDVSDAAGYNRSSFYLYFADVYDLAGAAEDALLADLQGLANDALAEAGSELSPYMAAFSARAEPLAERILLYAGSQTFRSKFAGLLAPLFSEVSGIDPANPGFGFVVSLVMCAMLHNIEYWDAHREEMSLAEAMALSQRVLAPGLASLAG